jgi:hypothetical protein
LHLPKDKMGSRISWEILFVWEIWAQNRVPLSK